MAQTVLLVEDNPADAQAVCRELAAQPNAPTVEIATSAAEAEARLALGGVWAVVLDLGLPDADGMASLVRVRAADPEIPVVVFTGADAELEGPEAIEHGAEDYLVKGIHGGRAILRALRYAAERSRTRRLIAEQHSIVRSVLDSLADGVVVVEPDGRVRLSNPAARELLGWRQRESTQNPWLLADQATPLPDADRPLARAARGDVADDLLMFVPGEDGGRWLSANIRPMHGRSGGVAVLRDVTAKKADEGRIRRLNSRLGAEVAERSRALEKLEAADRLKEQFLDVVSHELRTPLTPILGYTRLLLRRGGVGLTPAQKEGIELIQESAKRLYGVVDGMLDFQQLRAHGVGGGDEATHVDSLFHRLEEMARRRLGDGDVSLAFRLDDDLPETLVLDAAHTQKVLERLVENAILFTEEGFVRVEARLDEAAGRLVVDVRDSGVGIDAAHHELVFGAFYQVEAAHTRKHGGLGLGLAHARYMAEALGGIIRLESAPGVGSTFTLEVPARTLEDV